MYKLAKKYIEHFVVKMEGNQTKYIVLWKVEFDTVLYQTVYCQYACSCENLACDFDWIFGFR